MFLYIYFIYIHMCINMTVFFIICNYVVLVITFWLLLPWFSCVFFPCWFYDYVTLTDLFYAFTKKLSGEHFMVLEAIKFLIYQNLNLLRWWGHLRDIHGVSEKEKHVANFWVFEIIMWHQQWKFIIQVCICISFYGDQIMLLDKLICCHLNLVSTL